MYGNAAGLAAASDSIRRRGRFTSCPRRQRPEVLVAEIQISQDEIDRLAESLDELDLPAEQKTLLFAIVALATEAIVAKGHPVLVEVDQPIPSFKAQFAVAFVPGVTTHTLGSHSVTRSVTRSNPV
jgi:hypothetical protein